MKNTSPILGHSAFTPFAVRNEFVTPLDKILDTVFNKTFPELTREFGISCFGNESFPKVDILSNDSQVIIEAEIYGLSKDDISVNVTENAGVNTLTISGQKAGSREKRPNAEYLRREIRRSAFSRTFELSDQIDASTIDAKFENGLLTVVFQYRKQPNTPKSKTVTIK